MDTRPAFAPTRSYCFTPDQFSPEDRARFAAMVREGGEVTGTGLEDRISQAAYLSFLYDRDKILCGVAALKRPAPEYHQTVFAKAETRFDPIGFGYELGWIVVGAKYRGHGLTRRLLDPLIKRVPNEQVYATTRIDNEPMRRSLVRYGFQSDGTHFENTDGTAFLVLHLRSEAMQDLTGPLTVRGQYHGSPNNFESFEAHDLKSVGYHFGDIVQAKHFAKENGFIYHADLTFDRCLDIRNDWGWTSAQHVALALHNQCTQRHIAVKVEDFMPILGPPGWSMHSFKKPNRISAEEQRLLIELFVRCGFDGVRYLNKFEPPGSINRVAYFVTRPDQIKRRGKKPASEHKV